MSPDASLLDSSEPCSAHPFFYLPGLPVSARPLVARLLTRPPGAIAELVAAVAAYRRVIDRAASELAQANVALGHAIADALATFLARVDERVGEEELRVIQVAVLFFVIECDGFGHDLVHEDGLFGDARVVNAMLRWFGRDDLAIALPDAASSRTPRAVRG